MKREADIVTGRFWVFMLEAGVRISAPVMTPIAASHFKPCTVQS